MLNILLLAAVFFCNSVTDERWNTWDFVPQENDLILVDFGFNEIKEYRILKYNKFCLHHHDKLGKWLKLNPQILWEFINKKDFVEITIR